MVSSKHIGEAVKWVGNERIRRKKIISKEG